jgi:hypothetical protein
MLRKIDQNDAPDVVLLPEYCFEVEHLEKLRTQSSRLSRTVIITAMLEAKPVPGEGVFRRNQALRFLGGKIRRIYNKIDSELTGVDGDSSPQNVAAFEDQDRNRFVSICNDKFRVWHLDLLPRIWLIPAKDIISRYAITPPPGFQGHIIFANGHPDANRSSYWMRVERPFAAGSLEPQPTLEIPLGKEGMVTATT